MRNLTLPIDSQERKEVPVTSGVLMYFPAAIAGVARISKMGNDKHNPGQPLHHARGKSTDHTDCIVRHLMDVNDIEAVLNLYNQSIGVFGPEDDVRYAERKQQILLEASQLAWRALALSQELHEKYGGAPMAPGAK